MKTEGDSNLHFNKEEMYKAIDEALACGATVSIDEYLNSVYVQPKQYFKYNSNDMYKKDNDINIRAMEHRRNILELEKNRERPIKIFMIILLVTVIIGIALVVLDISREKMDYKSIREMVEKLWIPKIRKEISDIVGKEKIDKLNNEEVLHLWNLMKKNEEQVGNDQEKRILQVGKDQADR